MGSENETLRGYVLEWVEYRAEDYDGDREAVLKDLMHGGCQSGIVGTLIYYTDTTAFYNRFQSEIDALVAELISETGEAVNVLFSRMGWELSDPFARDPINQNILAWFGFEETAYRIAMEEGLEL